MGTSYRERDYACGSALLTLRTRIGLTQAQLANLLGISRRAVGEWETGNSYPKAEHLKALIERAIQHQAFPSGHEAREIRGLWKTAHQKVLLDEDWLSALLLAPQHEMGSQSKKEIVSYATARIGPASEPERLGRRHNLPFLQNPFFTGRQHLLKDLEQLFEQNACLALTQPISVSGLGGIGKTQLALEYAHRSYPHIYQSVLWVNADDQATLQASYLTLAHLLQLPEREAPEVDRIVQAVKRWLEEQSNWLLILDNADDLAITRAYLPSKPRGHILLTTRSQIVGNLATLVQIEAMPTEEGLIFLLRRCGVLRPRTALESLPLDLRREASSLVELLGGHPLALDQVGAYIEETRDPEIEVSGASFAEYRHLYQEQRRMLLRRRGLFLGEHPETVETTLSISLQKARALHPKCAEVLAFCALLHPYGIPEELLRKGSGLNLDLLQFNEVIGALRRYSLIKRDSEKKELSLHRLVQVVIKDGMETQELEQWIERVVRALNRAFPEVTFGGSATFEKWAQCERYLPHVLVCANWIEEHGAISPSQAGSLLSKAGAYLQERGQYSQAEPLYQRALSIREQHLGGEHPDTATSLNNLAILYWNQGKYSLAEPLHQRALSIREHKLGAEHLDIAKSLNNLAILYWEQGKYSQVEPLYQRVLSIREHKLGTEHLDTAKSLNNLAILYWEQGKYEQAEPLYQRVLSIREHKLGTEHLDTAKSLNNLATLYWKQGKYSQAESLHQRVLSIFKQHLGSEHPHTARSLNNLAIIYYLQGKYSQAELLYRQALSIYEPHLGTDHPDTADCLHNLAETLHAQGKYSQAELLYRQALAIFEQHLGTEHPEIARILNNLANLCSDQGKYSEGEPLYERALAIFEQHLSTEHPDTANCLRCLADLYSRQGKYSEGEPLYERALAIFEQHLGTEHPLMFHVLQGLAELAQHQGKAEQAEALYQRVLALREKHLGADHPDTQKTRKAYAAFLRARDHT